MKKAFVTAAMLITSVSTIAAPLEVDAQWIVSSIDTVEVSAAGIDSGSQGGTLDRRTTTNTNNNSSFNPFDKRRTGFGVNGSTVAGSGTGTGDGTFQDRTEKVGTVIGLAKDLVALGEAVYELVKKGKPTNTTEYAPISVLPKAAVSGREVEWDELENFSMPTEKKFVTSIKNGMGKEVVRFEYMIIFSYGGTYNGAGQYIAGAEIVPVSVKTSFGWDFNATMKPGGLMNNGTVASPVAGINLTIKYQMNSWSSSFERNDLIYINGAGQIKSYSR